MKRYKQQFKETGEWSDYDAEDIAWKEQLESDMKTLEKLTRKKARVIDVRGFDKYQGPYAIVKIKGKNFKIWTSDEYSTGFSFYVENFPVVNTDRNEHDGYKAVDIYDLAEVISNL